MASEDCGSDFANLYRRAQAREPEACEQLVKKYSYALYHVYQRYWELQHDACYDADDFRSSVWRVFFAEVIDKKSFESPEKLLAYIAEMARNKLSNVRRKESTQKRNSGPTVELPATVEDRRPSPAQLAAIREEWEALLAKFSPKWQQAMTMMRDGHSPSDVATMLGISERTIARLMGRVRKGMDRFAVLRSN